MFSLVTFLDCVCVCVYFDQYSGSSPTMSEEDFAHVVLRHTTWDLDPVFRRLRLRPPSRVSCVCCV